MGAAMGMALDSDQTFEFPLTGKQTVLVFRFLTGREWFRVARMMDETFHIESDAKTLEQLLEAFAIGLVGWQVEGKPYDPTELDDVLTFADALELRRELLSRMTLAELDRKNSARQSQSASKSSAATAGTDSTTAGTQSAKPSVA